MRDLDKNTSYDLRDLNESQLKEFKQECIKHGATNVFYKDSVDDFNEYIKMNNVQFSDMIFNGKWCIGKGLNQSVNALTLFEPQLKIGDTFEYNGFICEVKEKIEENIWFLLKNKYTKSITYRYAKEKEFDCFDNDKDYECIIITNKEFIKQLEENALS